MDKISTGNPIGIEVSGLEPECCGFNSRSVHFYFPEIYMKIKIDIARCKGCSLCVSECPCKNIRMSDDLNKKGTNYAKIISQEDCTGCALCFKMCPDVAIEINSRG